MGMRRWRLEVQNRSDWSTLLESAQVPGELWGYLGEIKRITRCSGVIVCGKP